MKHQWEDIANVYGEKILTTDKILYPAIFNHITEYSNKKILDIGCGAGHLSYELSQKGWNVIGIDSSLQMIQMAQKFYKHINVHHLPIEELILMEETDFDYAIAIMVFLCLQKESFIKAFKNIEYKIKVGGKLIMIDLHPCAKKSFDTPIFSQTFPENAYFHSWEEIQVTLHNKQNQKMDFIDYHWTLANLSDAIRNTTLYISDIKELQASPELVKEYPELIFFSDNPIYILIELTKHK